MTNKKNKIKEIYGFLLKNSKQNYTKYELHKKLKIQIETITSALNVAEDMGKVKCVQDGKNKTYQALDELKDLIAIAENVERAKTNQENKRTITSQEREEATKSLTLDELTDILGITIKHENSNKTITFLCMLSAYTNDSQFNISNRAPSATGKSYIPLELVDMFPKEDAKLIAYSSPTSFFHDTGEWDDTTKSIKIDLSRKIIIFVDQPHDALLQRLRPLLSHDKRELLYKITDKQEKQGLRTKNVLIIGFPSVIFCTGSLKMDEQESTRNIVLSPETTQEKIREALYLKADKESDPHNYKQLIADPQRELLKIRIELIKKENVINVIVPNPEHIADRFMKEQKKLKPRHTRDLGRVFCFIKALALLNLWQRIRDSDNNIIANDEDVESGFKLYSEISKSQELGIPPYIYRLYEEIFIPLFKEYPSGITKKQIVSKHFEIYGRPLQDWQLRQEIMPALEAAALIYEEPDPEDKRRMLIYHTVSLTISSEKNIVSKGVGESNGKCEMCEMCGEVGSLKKVKDESKQDGFLWICDKC